MFEDCGVIGGGGVPGCGGELVLEEGELALGVALGGGGDAVPDGVQGSGGGGVGVRSEGSAGVVKKLPVPDAPHGGRGGGGVPALVQGCYLADKPGCEECVGARLNPPVEIGTRRCESDDARVPLGVDGAGRGEL